jgi:hypothetical protein
MATTKPAPTTSLLSEFVQFFEDIPFGQIASAIKTGGTDVALDVAAGKALLEDVFTEFFHGGTVASATAVVAAAGKVPPPAS